MTSGIRILPETLTDHSDTIRQEQRQLLKPFWLATTVLTLIEIYTVKSSTLSILGAILIAFAALLPLYLWCSGKALGMPIFPIFALTYLWTYALPLVSDHPKIIIFTPEKHLVASLTVAGFLLLGTFVWFQFVNSPPALPKRYRVLSSQSSDGFFLTILAAGVLFNVCSIGGWLSFGGGTFTLIRNSILGLNVLAVFILSYRSGMKELSKSNHYTFLILLVTYIIVSTIPLVLIRSLSIVLLSVIAFTVGRHKVPWISIIIVVSCFSFLHYGKTEMRAKYWVDDKPHFIQPWEYSAWYGEWIDNSFKYFNDKNSQQESKKDVSLSRRSSVIQMMLLAQGLTPKYVPYLSGETYTIIPHLLVPRILNKNKLRSHEGTYILNIRYGLQNREATLSTTIAWGLLSEAYANFGFLGCAGLSIIVGATYGQVTRWSLNLPLLSSRSLFGVLMISFAFQTEWTAGVYFAALFQSVVPLVIITFVFMKAHTNIETLFPYVQDFIEVRHEE